MPESPLVSVVVLNWNGRHLLPTCLDALLEQTYSRLEIILVDNASADGSLAFVQQRYGNRIRSISLARNRGYAHGNNVGFRAGGGEFMATLNNDTRTHPDWVKNLVDGISRSPDIGVCASRQVRLGAPDIIDAVGIGIHSNGESWNFGGGQKDRGQFDSPMEVFGAHGASAFYRRKTLEQAGVFDDDFFAYHEEFDLCWRIRLMGWRCLYAPDAVLEHQGGATVRRCPGLRDYLSSRNRLFCIIKNYPSEALLWELPALAKCELWNLYLGLLRGENFRLRARSDAAGMLGNMLAKRRDIQARRRITSTAFRTWLGVSMRAPKGLL